MRRPIQSSAPTDAQREATVAKACLRAAEHLGLTNSQLADVIGISESSVSRMGKGAYLLTYGSKQYELALLFLRLFRGLDAILGSDDVASRSWLQSENTSLRGKPIDLILSVTGLNHVADYVDSRRARI
ncbi:MAG TPA: DUF2384 domain-containing protein [Rhodospirillaceae bacterium]|nr:DUF2384 domain-containing protein [Rhodospirillaceae bacterium]